MLTYQEKKQDDYLGNHGTVQCRTNPSIPSSDLAVVEDSYSRLLKPTAQLRHKNEFLITKCILVGRKVKIRRNDG